MKWLCSAMLALSMFTPTARAAPPPAEILFAEPSLGATTLSPDGRKVALLVRGKGQRARLAVLDLETMKPRPVAGFDDQDLLAAGWVSDQRLFFVGRVELTGPSRTDIGSGLYAVNADGTGFRQLVQAEGRPFVQRADAPSLLPWNTHVYHVPGQATGNDLIVGRPEELNRERVGHFNLQRLNTVTGRVLDIETPLHSRSWVFDERGDLRAAIVEQEGRGAVLLRQGDGSWKELSRYDRVAGSDLLPAGLGPDGTVYVRAGHEGRTALFALDAATGRPAGPPLAASKVFDLAPQLIADERRLLGLRYTIDAEVTQWLDPAMQALQARIDKLLPATANRLDIPRRGDSPWVLVQAFSEAQPTLHYVFHRESGNLTLLGGGLPGLMAQQLGLTDFVHYPARDGLSIPAWLTLPPGGGKALPLVVMVHGGPFVRGRSWRYSPEVQFLASRGYAVLEPEFRGSAGFGRRHLEAGFKQWGRAMQDDIADAARWAIAQGHADPKRIAIAGASYGGYATLMGLARDPELFRCGINWVGVTDIELMFGSSWSDIRGEFKRYDMAQMIGDPVADADLLKSASPVHNAAHIKQPLLMAYGAWDTRVPLVHGERFRDAVKAHNGAVEWVVYDNEGHGWRRLETNVDFWTRVEKFLARNLAVR
jgi:dipeptidyl aminopeptidase/acylaminoacyl peptidase